MNTRLEIYKDEIWSRLKLFESNNFKYNKLINKISNFDDRSISHTNTFSIPKIHENIQLLGINSFNPKKMAAALNRKYKAKYYIDEKLSQEGFIVINNKDGDDINVNFIDGALSIIEKWGSTTLNELLSSDTLPIPSDYATAISEMKNYQVPIDSILANLSDVGSRGYKLALYPNNLNVIGDKFQLDQNENRIDDAFNPYQSRPIFNAKSIFDLASETYGYTPIFDSSVDWDLLSRTFVVSDKLNENLRDDGGIVDRNFGIITSVTYGDEEGDVIENDPSNPDDDEVEYFLFGLSNFDSSVSLNPTNDIPGWDSLGDGIYGSYFPDENMLFQPFVGNGNIGEITFTVNRPTGAFHSSSSEPYDTEVIAVWYNPGETETIYKLMPLVSDNIVATNQRILVLDKVEFDNPPTGAGRFLGVFVNNVFRRASSPTPRNFTTLVSETLLPQNVISYDEFGQFLGTAIDLTYAAPNDSIKKLLKGLMHKEGILMNIDSLSKEIYFFSYGAYEDKKNNNDYIDFSGFFLKHYDVNYNTDFGNNYAIVNRVGLSEPYKGNTNTVNIGDLELTKYKDFTENFVTTYKDISSVQKILNTNTPYFEYTNEGLGLVENTGTIGTLTQVRANGTSQGTFSGLEALQNINYFTLPIGVIEWYNLVKRGLKVKGKFLIPNQDFRNLDLSKPVYVGQLGGYYIIEEMSEYIDGQNPVDVNLIKLIDNIRE